MATQYIFEVLEGFGILYEKWWWPISMKRYLLKYPAYGYILNVLASGCRLLYSIKYMMVSSKEIWRCESWEVE
jgi:hypothetical protein